MRGFVAAVLACVLAYALCLTAATMAHATPPGGNGRIAYRLFFNEEQTRSAIFTINPDGSGKRQVTHPPRGVLHLVPDWSPDGRWIAYVRAPIDRIHPHPGDDPHPRIWKMRRNGKHQQPVSKECGKTPGCIIEDDPAWSPRGHRIAFTRAYESRLHRGPEIVMMGADGTHVRRVTSHPSGRFADWQVQWAPRGKRLVFQRNDSLRDRSAIFTIRSDGSGLRRVTPWTGAQFPDWSPDGTWIAFTSQTVENDIWMVHPTGEGLHQVTKVPNVQWISVSFSPDGTMIVSTRTPGVGEAGSADVFVMNADGSSITNITQSEKWDSGPDWGPQVS